MKKTLLFFLLATSSLSAQTIAEKKESFKRIDQDLDDGNIAELREVNSLLETKRFELSQLYQRAERFYQEKSDERRYLPLLAEIKTLRKEIEHIQKMWKDEAASFAVNEEYSLWHQPETTLQQLVMDYGSPDFIYLIPPEIAGFRLSLNSAIAIPRESWGDCLELILNQYGIGIRQLNPYLRELYVLRIDQGSEIKAIIDDIEKIDFFPPNARLCFVLSPSGTDPKSDLRFLQKFSNPNATHIEIIGGKIFITGLASSLQEVVKLYTFAKSTASLQEFHLATLSKIDAKEMETILLTAFHDGKVIEGGSTLRVIPLQNLSQSLFLSGNKEEIRKALQLIKEVEMQIEDPEEKTVFWYTVKHSDAEELASLLAKFYDLLIENNSGKIENAKPSSQEAKKEEKHVVPALSIGPKVGQKTSHKTADGQNNFIVDPKTGSIIMVVRQEALPKIKELLKKLDVPKKMVQLEVLLFEKKITNQSKCGLNLLRLGSSATQATATALNWNAVSMGSGILEFLINRSKGSGIPAYDMAYQFLLGQEDVQINASPSVTTMNQTPATIAVVEEISIDAGADDKKSRIFQRAQYGITIQITPTINLDEGEEQSEGSGYITLETDITFDTTKNNADSRPDVTRRHIKNHVRIADGQTLILGGLRRKNSQDNKDSIPFLGEIPGIGKLFCHTEMSDSSTEMFVFITPKIIADPLQDIEKIRKEQLAKRPGDLPEFVRQLESAKAKQKQKLFEKSFSALFGRETLAHQDRKELQEYDGR